jgi:hypothetical protein
MDERIDKSSTFVSPYELAGGRIQPTDPTIVKVTDVPHQPTSIIDNGGEIIFDIHSNSEEYMRVSNFAFTYGASIETEDGKPITANDNVGPIQNAGHSFISGYTIQYGHHVVSSCTNYPYQAYFSTHLFYGPEAKKSLLSCTGWVEDTPEYPHDVPGAANRNEGLKKRTAMFANGKVVYFRIRLVCDVFNVEKLLPSNIGIRVTLYRANSAFCLMAGKTADGEEPPPYRVKFSRPTLWASKASLLPNVLIGLCKSIKEEPVKIKLNKVVIRINTIPAGVQSFTVDNVTTDQVPKCMFYGLVPNKAVTGSYGMNPLNFSHSNVTQTCLYVNGTQHPTIPFRPNYEFGDYCREFYSIFEGTGKLYSNSGLSITYDSFPLRDSLYGYDLTNNRNVGNSSSVGFIQRGPTRVDWQFSKPTSEVMSQISYCVYDTVLTINSDYSSQLSNPLLK